MQIYCPLGLAFSEPVCNCKRDCHSHDEHEEGLNQIPEMKSMPFMMVELGSQEMEDSIVGTQQQGEKVRCLTCKQEHCESAEEIDRCNSSGKSGTG